jgi:hypothetical protein
VIAERSEVIYYEVYQLPFTTVMKLLVIIEEQFLLVLNQLWTLSEQQKPV